MMLLATVAVKAGAVTNAAQVKVERVPAGGGWMEASAHGGPPLLRQINSAHVVAALRGAGPLSLSDLATRTGLSRPTVGQVVDQLQASGLLAWVEPGQAPRAGQDGADQRS